MSMNEYKYNIGDIVKVKVDGDGKTDSHGLINDFSKDDIFKIFFRHSISDGNLSFATYHGEGEGKSGWCPEGQLILVENANEASWKEINERFERIEEGQRQFKELVDTLEKQMKAWKKKFPGS